MKTRYDVIIVGSGPAGMFTALELIKIHPTLHIAIFEKGAIREPGRANSVPSFSQKLTEKVLRYPLLSCIRRSLWFL